MKRNLILLAIVLAVGLTSCTEDKYKDWTLINNQWSALHQNDPGFEKLPSGLQFRADYKAYDDKIILDNKSLIVVKYTGKLVDGTTFGESLRDTMYLSDLVAGWQEGLRLMRVGSKFKFYIPSNLGYGSSTAKPTVPANSILIFDVELLQLIPN